METRSTTPGWGRFLPYVLFLALTAGAFLVGSLVPYRVDSDIAFQAKSIDQWARGDSPSPATLRLPDPADLSQDTLVKSNWWPPAFPYLYAPLAALGLSLAAALRITSLLLFLAGGLGFLRLAEGLPRTVRVLYAIALAAYALTLGGSASLRIVDVLSFAAGPWLCLMALRVLRQDGRETSPILLFLCGLALGATYWVRYALFLTALPILLWLAWHTFRELASRWRSLLALGAGFALPVLVLFLLNLRQADLTESLSGKRSVWVVDDKAAAPPFLLLTLTGAPGLGLFQGNLWMEHLTFFSDSHLPALGRLDHEDRLALKTLLGIPGTLALAWGLARARRQGIGDTWDIGGDTGDTRAVSLVTLITLCFYLELTAVSLLVGYNYLANEPRLAAGFLPWAQGLLLAQWLGSWQRPGLMKRLPPALALAFFFALPVAFVAANFARNDLRDRLALGYRASATGLFMPELSLRDVPALRAAVAANLRSPGDVIVLSGKSWGGYSAFVPWLEFPGRVFPVAPFFAPLGARYQETADLNGSGAFRSTRPLRVVLVTARDLTADGTLRRLQARFPQGRTWRKAPAPPQANVEIHVSDLEVH